MGSFDTKPDAIGRIFSSLLYGCEFVPFSVMHDEDEDNEFWEEYVIRRIDGVVDRYRIYYMNTRICRTEEASKNGD